jgi:hypothetical protein
MFLRGISFLLLSLTLICSGCGKDDSPGTAESQGVPLGKGVIQGRVILSGNPPVMDYIPISPKIKDESIIVGTDGGLENVIVFLKDAPRCSSILQTPAVLDQINCKYVPHVLAVQAGQILRLKSSDAIMHNVNIQSSANPPANYSFSAPGIHDIVLKFPEDPFIVKCDVHQWMKAWVGVFKHPWFAVTGEDGSFTIENVPAGTYTLAAWQEVLPQQEQQIAVTDQAPTKAQFTFQAP